MNKKRKLPDARRLAEYLRILGAKSWKELTPEQRTAAYKRGLRYWQNSEGKLPEILG